MRLSASIDVDEPEESEQLAQWLKANCAHIVWISGYTGCGCCALGLDMEVSGSAESLPNNLQTSSCWTRDGEYYGKEDGSVEDALWILSEIST